jgi:hypothetical protein
MLRLDAMDDTAEEGREELGIDTPSAHPAIERERLAVELGREEQEELCRW